MLETPSPDRRHTSDIPRPAPGAHHEGTFGLPVPLTTLVGREREVAATREAIGASGVRLVTLTGPGGVGKSRVAIQAAWGLRQELADAVRLVRLAALDDPALLLPTIALALNFPHPEGPRLIDALRAEVAGKQVMLLLDSFDPIMAAAPLLADLLRACPDLKVLVTSRERLRLRGERVLRVPPLPTPADEEAGDPAALAQNPAVRLFVQQALEVDPDFRLSAENAIVVAGIVRRVDGLPLAIELAAARLALFPPEALLARLDRRLPLLSGGAADLPQRLRTMRTAIAWSYDLLTGEEQRLFRALAIFADGFPLEAAEVVAGDEGGDALEGIASLLDKSLLFPVTAADAGSRYALLETIREFGLEQLEAAAELETVRHRHADWCIGLAEAAAASRFQGTGTAAWLERLAIDHDDLRAALGWLEKKGDPDRFLRLAAALGWFWLHRSHRGEGRRWLTRAIGQARAAGIQGVSLARALDGAAVLAFTQGDYDEAGAIAADYLALSEEIGDAWGAAAALNLLGVVARAAGAWDRAAIAFTQALTRFQSQAEVDWAALALLNLGTVAFWQGDLDRANALISEALVTFREKDDVYFTAVALSDLALVATRRADHSRAAEMFIASLSSWREVGTKEGIIDWLARVATLAAASGAHALAARLFAAAERARETIGYTFELPEAARQQGVQDAVRAVLGDAVFTTNMLAGRHISLEDATAEAAQFLSMPGAAAAEDVKVEEPAPFGLTPRERDVLRLLVDGRSDRQIGDTLSISHRTVMRHVEHILAKLDVDSRTAAATQAVRLGLA